MSTIFLTIFSHSADWQSDNDYRRRKNLVNRRIVKYLSRIMLARTYVYIKRGSACLLLLFLILIWLSSGIA